MPPGMDLLEIVQNGALATYPLIFLSILNFGVVLERWFSLRSVRRGTMKIADGVLAAVAKGEPEAAKAVCAEKPSAPASRIFSRLLARGRNQDHEAAHAIASEATFAETTELKKNVWILGTVAGSAPFIGLLGTVVGIIKSFHSMAATGSGGFTVVAAGISEALVATALGLGVAIVALIFFNYFQTRIANLNATFRIQAARVLETLNPGA